MMQSSNCAYKRITMTVKQCSMLLMGIVMLPVLVFAQTEPTEALRDATPSVHAFTNATVVTAPGQQIDNATLVIRDGKVEEVGTGVQPPTDARVWDLEGKTIYPGFIDPFSDVGMQNPREELERGDQHWNPQVRAFLSAADEFSPEEDGSGELRSQGFTVAQSVPPIGIFSGSTAALSLSDAEVSDRVVRSDIAQAAKLYRSGELDFTYPNSAMGVIALIRQTLYDSEWYERAQAAYEQDPGQVERPESNAALRALRQAANGEQPLLFEARSEHEILRSLQFEDEFPVNTWVRGSGHEYRILDRLSELNPPLILPVDFPDVPDVETPEEALDRSLQQLRHWYLAPENPARVADAGLDFSFTADGLDEPGEFLHNVRKSVKLGLDADEALAALTTRPARLLGIDQTHGTIEPGKAANLVVAEDNLFEKNARVLDVWVDGDRYRINEVALVDSRGEWEVASTRGVLDGTLTVEDNSGSRFNGHITVDGEEIEFKSAWQENEARRFYADLPGDELGFDGPVRMSASNTGDELSGWAQLPGGERIQWQAERTGLPEDHEVDEVEVPPRDVELADIRPPMAFGRERIPGQPEHVVVRNATIWTMGPQGKLEDADLLVTRGEVIEVGQNLQVPGGAMEIDAEGKHVTPGLIDAHLHSGIDGVNEVGHNIVPEVRMGDVLNINNSWMYRQLAGGLTTAHVMHGSANPIGGQNQHLKMRWGALPEQLKLEGAPRTVKFALGENVKRGDAYPRTRMGTEQIVADRFREARDYEARWQEWEQSGEGLPPRYDLRNEALLDIMDGEILIQSHSYRQDEILMLMRLAEQFDVQIDAFHHGVEAYKVAPELADHGAGAVVWSDWGAFKIEAYDNTVYNARLLTEAGVVTSLHSDNSQIAARMNWEAAKMVRAGMDPEDALALVTINTAKLLGIDDRVGSLEPGKDGDFVIWSDDPLSAFTTAQQTWVDGRRYFDKEEDQELRRQVEEERSELIRLIMEEQ